MAEYTIDKELARKVITLAHKYDVDKHELYKAFENGEDDFWIDELRVISGHEILNVLVEELESDAYVPGCFNADFLNHFLEIGSDAIRQMQEKGLHEALGIILIKGGHVDGSCYGKSLGIHHGLAAQYAGADGYGHHFNSYDFSEYEESILGTTYHFFPNYAL